MAEPRGVPVWLATATIALFSVLALLAPHGRRAPVPATRPAPLHWVMPPAPTVQLWLSTADRRLQLARQPDIPLTRSSAPATIVIDTQHRLQTITGFGAALTDASAWLIEQKLGDAQREAFLREMFGPPPGLNLTMTRLTIGASDFSLSHYTLDDMPAGQVDPTLAHFNVVPNLAYLIPVVQQALAINPKLRIIASPWSAPAWMKTSASLLGDSLLEAYESAFADYLVRYVDTYRRYGIPIFALTVQNEPMFQPQTYPGMALPDDARTRLIGQYLGPALARRQPKTLLLGWDHNWDDPMQPLAVLADPVAAGYIDGIAWHCYRGAPIAQTQVHQAYPDKDVYITECSGGDWASAKNGELLWFARDLLLGGLRNWARGVVYWNLVLDQHHGPHAGGCANCKGMVTLDTTTGAIHRNDEYYAFAHYSRFVLPGATRVESTATGKGIDNVAFENAGHGPLVLVVVNSDTAPRAVDVRQADRRLSYTMPPASVATFVWPADRRDDDDDAGDSPSP